LLNGSGKQAIKIPKYNRAIRNLSVPDNKTIKAHTANKEVYKYFLASRRLSPERVKVTLQFENRNQHKNC